ncbi:GGDEF domain-containing protein [Marinomonas sp.]|uniref:GGDEF domain-containing protein n=1 Tax=Marinomonas sp. TaxID=1904862 RepID=UPI003BA93810
MRARLQRLGRVKLVCIITIFAVILASSSNLFISELFNFQTTFFEDVLRSSLSAIFVAPLLSWHLVGIFYKLDVLEKNMSRLAKMDDLTSVCNRRFFYIQIEDWLGTESNRNAVYAFFVLDMDLFKGINDRYGHLCGDKVLVEFSDILRKLSPSPNIVGRLGGEEFAVFLPNVSQEKAEMLAASICQTIRDSEIDYDGEKVSCSVSIGVSININRQKSTIENAFKYADLALYDAKESGRDCYRVYLP